MLTRRTVVLVKQEVTYGVDPTPTPADNALEVYDFNIKPLPDKITRKPYKGTLGASPHVIGKTLFEGSFKLDVRGSGAVYSASVKPECDAILQACGFSATLDSTPSSEKYTYAPVSTAQKSVTIYAYYDGVIYKIRGAFASVKGNVSAGKISSLDFSFKGLYQLPVDGALVSPTLLTVQPPIVENAGLTIGGYAGGIYDAFEFDAGTAIGERLNINSPEGLHSLYIHDRDLSASISPLATLEATNAWWTKFKAGTSQALAITIGATQYNRMKINAPAVQFGGLDPGDRDGERTYQIPLSLAEVSGDDDLEIVFD
ncbi:MAG: phage tail tube protein [Nitrospira sp.]|nr:phage tail tube protein [Nitrospira sp.]